MISWEAAGEKRELRGYRREWVSVNWLTLLRGVLYKRL
jgi:hypothetical protein